MIWLDLFIMNSMKIRSCEHCVTCYKEGHSFLLIPTFYYQLYIIITVLIGDFLIVTFSPVSLDYYKISNIKLNNWENGKGINRDNSFKPLNLNDCLLKTISCAKIISLILFIFYVFIIFLCTECFLSIKNPLSSMNNRIIIKAFSDLSVINYYEFFCLMLYFYLVELKKWEYPCLYLLIEGLELISGISRSTNP